MLTGELYNPYDEVLVEDRTHARLLLGQLNQLRDDASAERIEILKELIPVQGEGAGIQTPFYCDYGYNIELGNGVFFNFNCVVLDVMKVSIGNHTLIGPAVQIYTATHPLNWEERATGLELAKSVTIGKHVWIGGGAIICPGVTIGDRTIIGAGSVVTKDIPSDVIAAGNPCRVIGQNKV